MTAVHLLDAVKRAVALEFKVPASSLGGKSRDLDIAMARHVMVYLLVQFMPVPDRLPARAGKTRASGDRDGATKPVARLLRRWPSGVRYSLRRVEDLRDDPVVDAQVSRLEGVVAQLVKDYHP